MLLAIKTEKNGDGGGAILVTVAGLMLGDGDGASIRDAVCTCDARNGRIRDIRFSARTEDPEPFFGERQAKHLQALCESVCKRIRK